MKDEKIICGFCRELLTNTRGSDATYARRYRDSVRNVRRIALIVGGRLCRVGGGWMKTVSCAVVLTIAVLFGAPALAQERLGPIPPEQMTETQKQAVAEFTKVRKNGPFGFWWGYLRVPEVTIPFLEIQTYVHDVLESPKSAIGEKLTHFAILMVARQWTQQVIWSLHEANAIKSGLKPEIVSALAAGRRPTPMSDDEEILYDFCIELQQNQSVSDHTYARMLARFGEKGVAEATLLQGEYTIMSMFMNVARTPLSDPKAKPPLNAFPR